MAFKETFEQLVQIERLLRSSSKPIEKRLEGEAEKKLRQKCEEDRAQAEKLTQALLDEYSDNLKAQRYLQQIIQDIKVELNILPKSTPRFIDTPDNPGWEQYGKFYDRERYQRLLPYCKLAYLSEQNGIPEEHALKLALIFDNVNDALSYVQKNLAQNNLAIHDACLFVLPDVNRCDFTQWKILIKKNINDATFRRLLANAPEIEDSLKNNKLARGQKLDRKKISDKKAEIEKVNKRFKELKRRHGSLTLSEEQEYQRLISQLSNLYSELFEVSAGISLKEADLKVLAACNEVFIKKTQGAYKFMLDNGLSKQDFEKFIKLQRQDDVTNIPDIIIDGKDFNYPGFYLMKVPVLDEMQAARAACFGKLTNCCQSLSGEAGEPCVIHGLTSPYGGFYVLCEGDINHPRIEDRVVGQAWAWRSKNGAIVFDSIETVDREPQTIKVTKQLFEQLGIMLVQNHHTEKVACGDSSGISNLVGVVPLNTQKEAFKDYNSYNDSDKQRVVYDNAYPYYWYDQDPIATQATEKMVEQIIAEDKPLIESTILCSLLNWLMMPYENDSPFFDLVKKSDEIQKSNCESLIRKVSEIAKRHNRQDELGPILDSMSKYLTNRLAPEEIISRVNKKTLPIFVLNQHRDNLLNYGLKNKHDGIVLCLMNFGLTIPDNKEKRTLLMSAAAAGLDKVVTKLIAQGVNVNEKDCFGKTALHYAMMSQNEGCVTKLIEAGTDLNSEQKVYLMFSAIYNIPSVFERLVELKIDLDTKVNGTTALHRAISNTNNTIALMLINAKVNVNTKTNCGETPLILAAGKGLSDVVDSLIENQSDIHAKANDGTTALIAAATTGSEEIVSTLLKLNVDVNAVTASNESALMHAIKYGYDNIAIKLIEAGANPNIVSQDAVPLISAIINGNTIIALKLIEAKANVNLKTLWITSALHEAIVNNLNDVAIKLIEAGARLDEPDLFGNTPLMEAAARGNSEVTLKLIEAGANVDFQNKGKTALTIAEEKHPKLASEMKEKLQTAERNKLDSVLKEAPDNLVSSLRKRRRP